MALKIVYKICCGIDVHKTFVVACVASTSDKGITSYESHRFSTYTSGLKTLLQWLIDRNCKDVCMESTSKYWIPVYNILEKGCSIVLAHPKYVKAIRGKKTDKKDAGLGGRPPEPNVRTDYAGQKAGGYPRDVLLPWRHGDFPADGFGR